MSNTIWAVDGSFFAQRLSGIQRYSIELLAALDRIVPPGFVEIVTPPGVETCTMSATARARTFTPTPAGG